MGPRGRLAELRSWFKDNQPLVFFLIALLLLSGCALWIPEEPPPPPPGEPATYVCLRRNVSLGCLRSEWRCTAPLEMRAGQDGAPRCVMPGRDY